MRHHANALTTETADLRNAAGPKLAWLFLGLVLASSAASTMSSLVTL